MPRDLALHSRRNKMHGALQFTTKLFPLLIIYCIMVNSSHAATISIDGLDALVLKKLSLHQGRCQSRYYLQWKTLQVP
jgi:hypothetical protein